MLIIVLMLVIVIELEELGAQSCKAARQES